MGLFNNYSKPGKGISREEAEKREYFPILFRKITLLLKTNLLFFGVNIILFALLAFFFSPLFTNAESQETEALLNHMSAVLRGNQLMSPLPFIILWLFSPTIAGLTYLCRNFARQLPVFLISDFFEHAKKNLKQSIIAGFIMSAVLYIYLTALFYYSSRSLIMTCIAFMIGLVLAMASFYVYPLIVTFDMPLKTIFKNSFLLGMINLPQNLLVLAALAVINIFLMLKYPVLWIILIVFFLIAFSSYTINFAAWNGISKNIEVQ